MKWIKRELNDGFQRQPSIGILQNSCFDKTHRKPPATLLKIGLRFRCFSVNLRKFISFFQKTFYLVAFSFYENKYSKRTSIEDSQSEGIYNLKLVIRWCCEKFKLLQIHSIFKKVICSTINTLSTYETIFLQMLRGLCQVTFPKYFVFFIVILLINGKNEK